MLRLILTRLYRERRRAALVALLFAAIGAAQLLHSAQTTGQTINWAGFAVVLGLMALLLFPAALLVAALLGPFRALLEILALALALNVWAPLLGLIEPTEPGAFTLHPLFGVMVIGLCLLALPVTDRLFPARRVAIRSRARSALPPSALFPGLALTPETVAQRGDPALMAADWIEPGRLMRIEERVDDIATITELHEVLAQEPDRLFHIRFRAEPAHSRARGSRGTLRYRLRPTRRGTRVEGERVYDNGTWRGRLVAWIDDSFGRYDDQYIARIEQASLA